MVSAEAGWGEGYGPVAVPVFKTELRGVSYADGSTPSLLRQVPLFTKNTLSPIKLFKKPDGQGFGLKMTPYFVP